MMQIILVGLGAGAAAALLFASVVSGSIAAIFLFYLAPLPILIAALGAQLAHPTPENLDAARENVRKMQFLEKLRHDAENLEAELDDELMKRVKGNFAYETAEWSYIHVAWVRPGHPWPVVHRTAFVH